MSTGVTPHLHYRAKSSPVQIFSASVKLVSETVVCEIPGGRFSADGTNEFGKDTLSSFQW